MVKKFVTKKADSEFDKSFAGIDTLYHEWITAMNVKDYDQAKEVFKTFGTFFPKVFKQSL